MTIMITSEESMARKMKMDRKPKVFAKTPPKTGPIAMLKLRTVK